jgi:hypothetical protein
MRELHNSSAFTAMRDLQDSPAMKAAREWVELSRTLRWAI